MKSQIPTVLNIALFIILLDPAGGIIGGRGVGGSGWKCKKEDTFWFCTPWKRYLSISGLVVGIILLSCCLAFGCKALGGEIQENNETSPRDGPKNIQDEKVRETMADVHKETFVV